jgi:hypothetical protein
MKYRKCNSELEQAVRPKHKVDKEEETRKRES